MTVAVGTDENLTTAAADEDLRREIAKLRKIVAVLMARVERSTDLQGNAFSLFQTAIVLEGRVGERSVQLESALRQVEAAKDLAETAQRRLREAIHSISEGFALFGADDRLILWNDNFVDLMAALGQEVTVGTSFEQVVVRAVAHGAVRDAEGCEADWIALRLAHHRNPDRPFVYRLGDGRWVQVNERRTHDGGTVAVYTDITEMASRTAELSTVNAALTEAKVAAERANQSKTRFLAAASHDLHQPLNAARLFAAALAERDGLDAAGRDLVVGIDNSLEAIESLLRALFDISKLDAGVMTAEPVDGPVAPLLDQLAREYLPQAREAGLALRVVPCGLAVRSDPRLLARILRNFLSNALRYTETGRILLGCRRRGDRLAIQVWDTGRGIPPDKVATVFQEFQQIGQPGRRRDKGMGLGLAIVERIARLLGHPIQVRSEPGWGSCFSVEVPVAAAPVAGVGGMAPVAAGPAAADLAGLAVVAIDDDPTGLAALAALLTAWGCQVTALGSAAELDRWLRRRPPRPDLVVADHHLGGGADGPALVTRLRRRWGAELPAFIVTSDRDPALRAALKARGLPCLNKPLAPARLRALMTHLLAAAGR